MSQSNSKLDWCVIRLGEDLNWWVTEISDPIHWDVDGLGVIDPRQMSYILEQCDALREYGFDPDVIDEAFYAFRIDEEREGGRVRISLARDSLLEEESQLFALPDIIDEERGPFADFLDQITRFRVKMLNDLIDFDKSLTVDELEDEIRERQNQEYMEGRAVHPFAEITSILDFTPDGYELEDEEPRNKSEDEDIEDIPDFEDSDVDEKIEEDETMKWDEDEEDEDDFDDDEEETKDDEDSDDDEEDEEEEDDGKKSGRRR